MSDSWAPNGSIASPDLAKCQIFLTDSHNLLKQGWENPDQVGVGSKLLGACEQHLLSVRQFRTPTEVESERRNIFIGAMRIAWFATWMARDYSVSGLQKRFPELEAEVRRLENNTQTVSAAGRIWLEAHAPLFNEFGTLVESRQNTLSSHYGRAPALLQGSQIGWHKCFAQLRQFDQLDLSWSYTVATAEVGLTNQCRLDSALIESLVQPFELNGSRSNNLVGAIVLNEARLESISTTATLANARFEKSLHIRSARGQILPLLPPDVFVGDWLRLEGGNLENASTNIPTPGVRRIEWNSVAISGDLVIVPSEEPVEISLQGISIAGQLKATEATLSKFRMSGGVGGKIEFSKCDFHFPPDFSGMSSAIEIEFRDCLLGSKHEGVVNFDTMNAGQRFHMLGGKIGCGRDSKATFNRANLLVGRFTGVEFDCDVAMRIEPHCELHLIDSKFNHKFDFRLPSGTTGKRESATLQRCSFLGEVDFRNVAFGNTTEFDNCRFTQPPMFYDAELHSDTSFSGTKFDWQTNLSANWRTRTFAAVAGRLFPNRIDDKVKVDELYLGRVERAFTELREHAEAIRARPLAAQFHKEELEARRHRVLDRGVPRSERWMNSAYRTLSDYGDSFTQPFAWLLFAWIGFAVAYFGLSAWLVDNLASAVAISLAATFRPWAALDSGIARAASEWGGHCKELALAQRNGFSIIQSDYCLAVQLTHEFGVWFQALVILQSIVSIILIFLLLLAVRRKFQLG